jgi:hypothetical protein
MDFKKSLTTKGTKYTKIPVFKNFVLFFVPFVSFVVNSSFLGVR